MYYMETSNSVNSHPISNLLLPGGAPSLPGHIPRMSIPAHVTLVFQFKPACQSSATYNDRVPSCANRPSERKGLGISHSHHAKKKRNNKTYRTIAQRHQRRCDKHNAVKTGRADACLVIGGGVHFEPNYSVRKSNKVYMA